MKINYRSAIAYIKRSKKPLLLVIIVAVASVSTSTVISVLLSKYGNYTFPSLGYVKTIGVRAYWDQNGENMTDMLDWGTIEVGSSADVTLFIKSVSNYDVSLTFHLSDWDPISFSDYLVESWDYDGTVLKPGEMIELTFTLSAPSTSSFISYLVKNEIRSFSCFVHIVASEH